MKILTTLLVLGALSSSAQAAVRYVNVGLTTGADDGSSWENAYRTVDGVSRALTAAVSGDQVWVAAGTYEPTSGTARTVFITMKSGVAVYGGFTGTETDLAQRDLVGNPTILTGDLSRNDNGTTTNLADNSYHVVLATGVAATAVLDGFTVTGGYANGATASNYDKGGGIIILSNGQPTIRNCRFIGNRCTFGGGAGYVLSAGGSFTDCDFIDNLGGSYGGAFDTNAGAVTWTGCLFRNNQAARAGAIETFGVASRSITNCVFIQNRATSTNSGGAIWSGNSATVTVRNCTFVANTSATTTGAGYLNTGGTSSLANCVFWNNTGSSGSTVNNQVTTSAGTTTVSYSLVQGGATGTGNISTTPLFEDLAAFDLRLQPASPGVDAGSSSLIPAGITVDHDGLPRRVDIESTPDTGVGAPVVDMGAFETQAPPPPACTADVNADGTVDGADLGLLVGNWGGSGAGDIDANGSVDGADLGLLLSGWGACP
jgi:hypothetical protein